MKHYRIIRKWACKNNDLNDADLELLIYLDCIGFFNKKDFVWRHRNRTTQLHHLYQISFKCKQLIQRVYRIMLGEEDLPISKRRNKLIAGNSYTDKVMTKAIYNVNKDKNR